MIIGLHFRINLKSTKLKLNSLQMYIAAALPAPAIEQPRSHMIRWQWPTWQISYRKRLGGGGLEGELIMIGSQAREIFGLFSYEKYRAEINTYHDTKQRESS